MLLKPSVSAINKIRKKYSLSKTSSLSSKQFHEAVALTSAKSTQKKKGSDFGFSFEYRLITFTEKEVILEVKGKHISQNDVNSLPFRGKLAYKKAFKVGANAFYMKERLRLKSIPPIERSYISFVFYTKDSRDHDNNHENIKRTQDTLTVLNIIVDDKKANLRKEYTHEYEEEIIDSVPRILIKLRVVDKWER